MAVSLVPRDGGERKVMMPLIDSELRCRLRQATRQCHHALEHHPLLLPLFAPEIGLTEYGNALAALHGLYARSEAAVLQYLQQNPCLFDYRERRKLPAMESDLSALGRCHLPIDTAGPDLDSVGALFGTLYTLEGSTLGGQWIAQRLPPHCPRQFFTGYGAQTRQRWNEFLLVAQAQCPREAYETAAATAVVLFASFSKHFDDCHTMLDAAHIGTAALPASTESSGIGATETARRDHHRAILKPSGAIQCDPARDARRRAAPPG